MLKCGHDIESVLVTACIAEWDADDGQVEAMGEEHHHLIEDWVDTAESVCVGWHICPICKKPDGNPWIESHG